jgi:hypothetical protein
MGGWTVEDARDEEHRRQLIEEERRFVSHCARELDEIAAAALKFVLALWIQCSGEWEDLPKQIDDARAEVVSELQVSVARPGRRFPLEATKRDVEASLSGTLWRWRPRSPPQRMSWPPPGSAAPPHDDAGQRRSRDLRGLRDPSSNRTTARRRTLTAAPPTRCVQPIPSTRCSCAAPRGFASLSASR